MLILAKNTQKKLKLVKYILYVKNSLFFKENFQEKCQFKNQKIWKIMVFKKKNKTIQPKKNDGTAETVPAEVQQLQAVVHGSMQAGAVLKIEATINTGKISSVGYKFFFPCGGMAVVTSYST